MKDKKRNLDDTTEVIKVLTDTKQLDHEIESLNHELNVLTELTNRLIKENSKALRNNDEYENKYKELAERFKRTKNREEELIKTRDNKKIQALNLKSFISNLKRVDDKLSEWNENVWRLLVKSAVVNRDKDITFKFNNSNEIKTKYV